MTSAPDAKEKGQTADQVAAFCDITVRRVQQLAREQVFPKLGRGRYPLLRCVRAYIGMLRKQIEQKSQQWGTLEEARTRKTQAEAQLAELHLAREEGQLLTLSDYQRKIDEPLERLRAKLLNMPSKYAPQLVGCRTVQEAMLRMEAAVHEAMQAMSETGDEIDDDAGA